MKCPKTKKAEIVRDLANVVNKYSLENGSDTPDFILAEMLFSIIDVYNKTVKKRDSWWGKDPELCMTPEDIID